MTKLDHKGFSRSMEQFYSDVKLANHRSALAMEDILYELLRDTTENRLDMVWSYSLYERTGALLETIEKLDSTYKTRNNSSSTKISVGWNMKKLNNFRSQSHWGESVVQGTHRSFFGSKKFGTGVGESVPTPVILNEMDYNVQAKNKNHFKNFIFDTMSYYGQSVYAKNTYIDTFNESMDKYAQKSKR